MKNFDFIGQSRTLGIGGHTRLKSTIGGLSTILIFFVTIGSFVGFGFDLFKKENPLVVFNKYIDDLDGYSLTDENFILTIFNQENNAPFPEFDRKFYTYMDHFENYEDGTWDWYKYPFTPCSSEAMKYWEKDTATKEPYLCLPKGTNIKMKGIYGQGSFTSLRLQTVYCKNNTDPENGPVRNDCYDRSFIEKNITSRIQMHLLIKSSQVNTYNYTNPGFDIPYSKYVNTNPKTWTRLGILFKNIDISTDQGILFDDIRHDVYKGIDSVTADSVYTENTNVIFSHIMGNGKYKEFYTRSYIKIQSVFALMGGFVNGVRIILMAYVQYLTTPDVVNIFNSLYKYKPVNLNTNKIHVNTQINQNQSSIPITTIGVKKYNKLNSKNTNITTNNNDSTIIENRIKDMKTNYEKMKKYEYEYRKGMIKKAFRICITSNMDSQKEAFTETKRKMDEVLSIENIIKLTRTNTIIKTLFLEDYQDRILSVAPIPKDHLDMDYTNVIDRVRSNELSKFCDNLNTNFNKNIYNSFFKTSDNGLPNTVNVFQQI